MGIVRDSRLDGSSVACVGVAVGVVDCVR